MTQEEKQLLLIDLCGRLPYELIVSYTEFEYGIMSKHTFSNLEVWNNEVRDGTALVVCDNGHSKYYIEEIKPYLRPMSSMTEEEKNELRKLCDEDLSGYAKFILDGHGLSHDGLYMFYPLRQLDFINSHHFDFRGLIQKGLALEAPEDMYKTE